ncbi:ornithine carbamoyltransferase [Acetobacteraceae bacterium KSS8]|uniref:Ornithine carbamoyltransferase n=1 Tax=Endosaccharibacter trunci TaxID=2812733 RepID=A0ABT1W8G3_9PROT|nr:ornithine carbamoyltransferase [Acetobacteraceae bacterium KSS8]
MSAALKRPAGLDAAPTRHFLELRDLDTALLRRILAAAHRLKTVPRDRYAPKPLAGLTLGLMLEKPSTRTRVSFEVAMRQLGGEVVVLSPRDMQLGRGETLPDTARVLSRFLDAIVLRTDNHAKLAELAAHASIPVINGLTERSHPVQLLADIMTFEELRGPIAGRTLAWCGDGNNVAASWIEAAMRFGFTLRLATPPDMAPRQEVLDWAAREQAAGSAGRIALLSDPQAAVRGADCVITDTWTSMADDPAEDRASRLEAFRVDEALMALAAENALFMHCLPAHRGEEVTDGVIEGKWSAVFDEAENRLHAQKGLLAWALGGESWDGPVLDRETR